MTIRNMCSVRKSSSILAIHAICWSPTLPVAMNGGVAIAVETPTSATGHVRRPVPVAMKARSRHIGIVISRHHAHVGGPPQGFEPMACMGELGRERDIDEIAGDGHVVGLPAMKVAGDGIERIAAMEPTAAAPPIDVAEQAL